METTITQGTTEQQKQAYDNSLSSREWQQLREEILKRDLHRCRQCGSTENLQVHHRQYHVRAETGAWKKAHEYEARYLVTMCSRCHEAGHRQYDVPVFEV